MVKDIIDKSDILGRVSSLDIIILELGCGPKKEYSDSIAIDLIDFPCVDIIGDILSVLRRFPDNSVDKIFSSHVFEHLEQLPEILIEIRRVLSSDGELDIKVPHFSNSFFYSDPTHKTFFGLYTFSYYFNDNLLGRGVPDYEKIPGMELRSIKLIFKSYRPHYISHAIRKSVQWLVNLHPLLQEIYEESFVNFISCYEIHVVAKKKHV